MTHKTIIATGSDAHFYDFMLETLASLEALKLHERADIGIIDMGLKPEQVTALTARGFKVIIPEWTLPGQVYAKHNYEIGYVARTALRDYFPGYQVYLWFDADAWAQTDEFFDAFTEGAIAKGAAIVRENGTGMKRDLIYNRWWYGHMIMSHGLLGGIKTAFPPAINTGIVALSHNAPHWGLWIEAYKKMMIARERNNLDQHSFNAALMLNNLPAALLPARCNWICTLSPPVWNSATRQFCEPNKNAPPLSVLHLAGPAKRRVYQLYSTTGMPIATSVSFAESIELREGSQRAAA
jgi:lipopolysaccharide biosynthesis glycosyltransferase